MRRTTEVETIEEPRTIVETTSAVRCGLCDDDTEATYHHDPIPAKDAYVVAFGGTTDDAEFFSMSFDRFPVCERHATELLGDRPRCSGVGHVPDFPNSIRGLMWQLKRGLTILFADTFAMLWRDRWFIAFIFSVVLFVWALSLVFA